MLERRFTLAGCSLVPIVQGGMGVGISAYRLAGAVACEGDVGTIASIDLRHHHVDLVTTAEKSRDEDAINTANLVALDREIRAAREASQGNGMITVNMMKAVESHPALVRQARESGADTIVMGAGLPFDPPEVTTEHLKVVLIPILSDPRGVGVVLKRWMKKSRLPGAVVIEHPSRAGGHLGAARIGDLRDERFSSARVLDECRELFIKLGLAAEQTPIILAGGIDSRAKVKHWPDRGATVVQLGTTFTVTEEGDAHVRFKRVPTGAEQRDIGEFVGVAGLPAWAVMAPWLSRYLSRESTLQAKAKVRDCLQGFDYLQTCGLRDGIGKVGQFRTDLELTQALRGDAERGLFFRGAGKLPFGQAIRSVRELVHYLLTGEKPVTS